MVETETTTARCKHCGDHIGSADMAARIGDDVFCCSGCASVFEILSSHNLCSYYSIDASAGNSQRNVAADTTDYDALDTPEILKKFTEWKSGDLQRISFYVPSMHCASCVWLLEQLHKIDEGIRHSDVSYLNKTVAVEFNCTITQASSIARLLSHVGYPPLLNIEGDEQQRFSARRHVLRGLYLRLGVAGFAMANIMMIAVAVYFAGGIAGLPSELQEIFPWTAIALSVPVYFFSASPWLKGALAALKQLPRRGLQTVTLDVPVALGMTALFVRSIVEIVTGTGEGFLDSFVGLVFFLLVGRLLLEKAYARISFNRTYKSFFPLWVRREKRASEEIVPLEKITVGDILIIRNGEVIPADGILMGDTAFIDYSFVSGESRPVVVRNSQLLYAGGKAAGGLIRMVATSTVQQSYLVKLWERSAVRNSGSVYETVSNTFGRWFTIATILIALTAFVIWLPDTSSAFLVFSAVLIIACPCALTIAAPIALGTAMGVLGAKGIFLRTANTLADLLRIRAVAFDKTGTLTEAISEPDFSALVVSDTERQMVGCLASQSSHPVARTIARHCTYNSATMHAVGVHEVAGYGISGTVNGAEIRIGTAGFVQHHDTVAATHISINGDYRGYVRQTPTLRQGIINLRRLPNRLLLSGDTDQDKELFKAVFGQQMFFGLKPDEKRQLITRVQHETGRILMVGDGLNDAAAMAAANVSIAVTDHTGTLAPASDVVMNASRIQDIPALLTYARQIHRVVWATFVFSLAYNVLGIGLAVLGRLTPVMAAIMMPASSLIVIAMSVAGAHYYARKHVWQ